MRVRLLFMLNYTVLAPSGHNTQPWLFRVDEDRVLLYADRSRALPVIDPDDRELIMSCGAALFNLRITFRHYGITPMVEYAPDPDNGDLLAVVSAGTTYHPTLPEQRLFSAIKNRRTYRLPFQDKGVPAAEVTSLIQSAKVEGCTLVVLSKKEEKLALAAIATEANSVQGADKRFRRELAAWLHPNRSKSRDGIPGYAAGVGDFASRFGPMVVRSFDVGGGTAAQGRELAEGSPCLAILSTKGDDEAAWFRAGQALGHVLVQGAVYGLSASFLNQAIEVAALRPRVAELAGRSDAHTILRIGYGGELRPTPRRSVNDVLIH